MFSKVFTVGGAIRDTLNKDPIISESGFVFVLRKKPWGVDTPWEKGAFIYPLDPDDPNHENAIDTNLFRYGMTISKPTDGSLVEAHSSMLASIERAYDLFHNQSNRFMPKTMRDLQAVFDAQTALGTIPQTAINRVTSRRRRLFVASALQSGYDVCSCEIEAELRSVRPDVSDL